MRIVRVLIERFQYQIVADDAVPQEDLGEETTVAAGLLDQVDGVASVVSPRDYAYLRLEVETGYEKPQVDLTDWQDAVEWSMATATGDLRIVPLMDAPVGPQLAANGPGSYRLLLLARDRDPVGRAAPRDNQALFVWPGPVQPPLVHKLTSQFAADWSAPAPRRVSRSLDWAALARTPGVRLIVDWQALSAPADPSGQDRVTVQAESTVTGTAAEVFRRFSSRYCAGLGRGSLQPGGNGYPSRAAIVDFLEAEDDEGQPTAASQHIRNLSVQMDWVEETRYRRVAFRWGFLVQGLHYEGKDHPLSPGSTLVEIDIAKSGDGRRVHVSVHDVPRWLAADVEALWRLLLERNHDEEALLLPLPWQEFDYAESSA